MKLKDYIKKLQEIEKDYPDLEVIYAADDEGNHFRPVNHTPCLGNYGGGEFINDDGTEEFSQQFKINSICLN